MDLREAHFLELAMAFLTRKCPAKGAHARQPPRDFLNGYERRKCRRKYHCQIEKRELEDHPAPNPIQDQRLAGAR
jgi:hypothetical protein